ncbi:MAG: PKD domain-containing protein [Chitinophagaceae bacterium]|nr:PKD domain-containing protein [Chitinophagaceae bacterium]
MRRISLLTLFTGFFIFSYSQDFTNKGKEFWLCFPSHLPSGGSLARMSLFITSDKASSGTITIGGTLLSNFNVSANTVTEIDVPYNLAHIDPNESNAIIKKGINVKVDAGKPAVVVYAHIYAAARSAASLILPNTVLGRKYYSMNFKQDGVGGSKSQFEIIAVDSNTVVEVSLRREGVLDPPFSITLPLPGDVYQIQSDLDLTGSLIESVASIGPNAGCKKIAVFSGSSALTIQTDQGCSGGSNSYDPLYQQIYPVGSWGKNFAFIPFAAYSVGNPYRVLASENGTTVSINGSVVATLNEGEFYPKLSRNFPIPLNEAVIIAANKPISVAEYAQQARCRGTSPDDLGDPDMVLLNPIEQSVNNITVFSSTKEAISERYIQVVIKAAAAASFRINGTAPAGSWQPVQPAAAGYVYNRIQITSSATAYTLVADSNFNAIAYGFGNFESYAYSAGTNVKDLYQFVSIQNEYATVNFPAGCKNSPLKFAMTFPYQPTSITWRFGGLFADTTITTPIADSSWLFDGRTLYRYQMNRTYTIPAVGTYPISVIANNPTSDGCTGLQEIEYDLQIFDPPTADFTFTSNGCPTDSVAFTDNTNGLGRTLIKWIWQFGDGDTSILENPKHRYLTAGNKLVRHAAITDVGCVSNFVDKVIPLIDPPIAKFGITALTCEKTTISFTDSSSVVGGTIVRWRWNMGDGTTVDASNGNKVDHIYQTVGTYNVTLEVETNTGCKSFVFSKPVIVFPKPVVDFLAPSACLPNSALFTDQSIISDNTQSLFGYAWDFGDATTSAQKNPLHLYSAGGPFNVRLTVTSFNGCIDDTLKIVSTIYEQPKIAVTASPEKCLGDSVKVVVRINQPLNLKIKEFAITWGGEGTTTAVLTTDADSVVVYHTFITVGNQSITVFAKSQAPGSCYSDTVVVPVYINQLPLAAYTTGAIACEGEPVNFVDQSTSGDGTITGWAWALGNNNISAQQNPTAVYTTPGTYATSLVVTSSKGCTSTILSKPVSINYLPFVDFSVPEICLIDPFAPFNDSSTIADNSEAQFTYLWNFGDANANAGNPNTSTSKNPQHRYTATGNYSVQLTVTSKDGCRADTAKSFTVNGSVPIASYTVSNAATLCANKDVSIGDASTVDFGSIVKVEVYWDYGNDPTIKTVDENPTPGKTYSHRYPEFGTPAARTFNVRYVVYSGVNCLHEFSRAVVVNASPSIQFDPIAAVCEEINPYQLMGNEMFGFAGTGVFSGPGVIDPSGIFDPGKALPGIHTIQYNFNAVNGCSTSATQTVEVHPTPVIDAGPDRVLLEGGQVTLQGKASGRNLSVTWSPVTAMTSSVVINPVVSPVEDIVYNLKVVSGDGCTAEDNVKVTILKKPKIPNAFSPNNDGINDKWVIEHLESYPGATVEVFNRYGQLVYKSVGYDRPWDGNMNGHPLAVGTYYWIINPKNGRQQMNGSVTILR